MRYTSLTQEIYHKLFLSSLVIQMVGTISFFLDFIIPGSFLGEEALSIITLTMPLLLLMQAFVDLVSMGGSNAYSLEIGAGHPEAALRYFTATILGALAVSLAVLGLGWLCLEPLTRLLGADGALLGTTSQVTLLTLAYFPFMAVLMCMDFFLRNDGLIKLSAVVSVFFIGSNILLNIYLVGYTSLGILGAPLSSILSAVLSMLVASSVFFLKKTTLRFTRETTLADFRHVVRMGSGLTFKRVYQGVTVMVFNYFLMAFYGTIGVVVFSIVVNVQNLILGIFDTLRECLQPLVGVYSGEQNLEGIRETVRCSFKTGAVFGVGTCLLLWLMPAGWFKIFGITDGATLALCLEAVHIYAFIFPFMCFTEVMSSYYQFIGCPGLTFYILTLKGLVLLLPVSLLLFKLLGLNGLWAGFVVTELLSAGCCLLLARHKARRSGGKLSSVLLLDQSEQQRRLFGDWAVSRENLPSALDQVEDFLKARGTSAPLSNRVRHCLEEIGLNVLQHNPGRTDARLEVQVQLQDRVVLTIRDNCSAFNTTVPREQKIAPKLGLRLVHKLADEISYVPTIGYNRTILIFKQRQTQTGDGRTKES